MELVYLTLWELGSRSNAFIPGFSLFIVFFQGTLFYFTFAIPASIVLKQFPNYPSEIVSFVLE